MSSLTGAAFLPLIENVGLLALLVVVYASAAQPLAKLPALARQAVYGAVFGLAGMGVMAFPIEFAPGVIFDGRVVPMLLAGPFGGGPLAAAVATGLVTGNRVLIGGPGMVPAMTVALAVVMISSGLWWLRRRGRPFNGLTLGLGGALAALALFAALFTLGSDRAVAIIGALGPAYLVTIVLGTALFGYLLLLDDRRRDALRAAERARRAADLANQAKSRFLAQMSHELRTPLTGVLGMLDLMQGVELPATYRGYLDAMRSSSRTLLTLVNDILDFSKIEADRLVLAPEPVRVDRLAYDVMHFFQPRAEELGLGLSLNIEEGFPEVLRCDDHRIRQILFNLVGNALKFTERGFVSLDLRVVPDAAEPTLAFEVRDSGIGIEQERLEEIFEPFEQEDGSTTKRFGGSGLGLAISRRLAELMGGSLSVRSEKGVGSVFAFEVPHRALAAGDPQPSAGPGPAAPRDPDRAPSPVAGGGRAGQSAATGGAASDAGLEPSLAGLRILVAEDAPVTRLLLGEMLLKLGAVPTLVEDGQKALEQVGTGSFDVVLMDMQMPVLDGVEATKRIRALGGRFETLPILALTADVVPENRRHYHNVGLDGVLHKPVDWTELIAAIKVVQPDRPPLMAGPAGPRATTGADAAAAEPVPPPAPGAEPPAEALVRNAAGDRPSFDPAIRRALSDSIPPARFQEIVGLWPAFAEEHLALIRAALESGDGESFARAAHSVKGTAGYLGFPRLEALCLRAQRAAQEPHAAALLGAEICRELEVTLVEFRPPGSRTLHAVG